MGKKKAFTGRNWEDEKQLCRLGGGKYQDTAPASLDKTNNCEGERQAPIPNSTPIPQREPPGDPFSLSGLFWWKLQINSVQDKETRHPWAFLRYPSQFTWCWKPRPGIEHSPSSAQWIQDGNQWSGGRQGIGRWGQRTGRNKLKLRYLERGIDLCRGSVKLLTMGIRPNYPPTTATTNPLEKPLTTSKTNQQVNKNKLKKRQIRENNRECYAITNSDNYHMKMKHFCFELWHL